MRIGVFVGIKQVGFIISLYFVLAYDDYRRDNTRLYILPSILPRSQRRWQMQLYDSLSLRIPVKFSLLRVILSFYIHLNHWLRFVAAALCPWFVLWIGLE